MGFVGLSKISCGCISGSCLGVRGNAVSQGIGGAIVFLAIVFAFIALVRVFEDEWIIRELIFFFKAFGIESLWIIAVVLFLVGYYIFNAD